MSVLDRETTAGSRESRRPFCAGRRRALRGLGGVAGFTALFHVVGCGGDRKGESGPVQVPLSDLPAGGRIVVVWQRQPVEILRTGDAVRARSLICTHFGCIVKWDEEQDAYLCPCHEGRFDRDGRVVGGPPTASLTEIPVAISGDVAVVGG